MAYWHDAVQKAGLDGCLCTPGVDLGCEVPYHNSMPNGL
jgi:hypothetical protein